MAYSNTYETPRQNPVARAFADLYDSLARLGETSSRLHQIERLQALSDQELSARGLRRGDIARHVYRDTLYL